MQENKHERSHQQNNYHDKYQVRRLLDGALKNDLINRTTKKSTAMRKSSATRRSQMGTKKSDQSCWPSLGTYAAGRPAWDSGVSSGYQYRAQARNLDSTTFKEEPAFGTHHLHTRYFDASIQSNDRTTPANQGSRSATRGDEFSKSPSNRGLSSQ